MSPCCNVCLLSQVPNITGSSTTYEVMCDLDCIAGPETVSMSSSQASSYKVSKGFGVKFGVKDERFKVDCV